MPRTGNPNTIGAQISAASGTVNAGAIEVQDGSGVTRVTLGAIGGGDYGLKVVASDGATVIIDGTSDIFRIAATGTLTLNQAAHSTGTVEATLSALSFTSTPAHLSFSASSSSVTADANPFYFGTYVQAWASATNGGPTNLEGSSTGIHAFGYVRMSGTTPIFVFIIRNVGNPSAQQLWTRYYVLQQVAL